jgi:hypothetical protein
MPNIVNLSKQVLEGVFKHLPLIDPEKGQA